jgi:hypothetical protein
VSLATRHHYIRPATEEDRDVIARIASLDSSPPIEGPALVGEIDGIAVAVLSLADGRVIANPFRRTADLVDLMRVRGHALGGAHEPGFWRRRLRAALRRPRTAPVAL